MTLMPEASTHSCSKDGGQSLHHFHGENTGVIAALLLVVPSRQRGWLDIDLHKGQSPGSRQQLTPGSISGIQMLNMSTC